MGVIHIQYMRVSFYEMFKKLSEKITTPDAF